MPYTYHNSDYKWNQLIGDCNQLCDTDICTWELNTNGVCDTECNNTNCDFDFFNCLDANKTCFYNDENVNETCYNGWIFESDQWCDDNCRYHSECNYDDHICDSCQGNCATSYEVIVDFVAANNAPFELITKDEICDLWEQILYVFSTSTCVHVHCNICDIFNRLLAGNDFAWDNCTQYFLDSDTNDNGFIGLHEACILYNMGISIFCIMHSVGLNAFIDVAL